MNRGDIVTGWFDGGAAHSSGTIFGIVEKIGPKKMTVRWESGIRNRLTRGTDAVKIITDPELRAEAVQALRVNAAKGGA